MNVDLDRPTLSGDAPVIFPPTTLAQLPGRVTLSEKIEKGLDLTAFEKELGRRTGTYVDPKTLAKRVVFVNATTGKPNRATRRAAAKARGILGTDDVKTSPRAGGRPDPRARRSRVQRFARMAQWERDLYETSVR